MKTPCIAACKNNAGLCAGCHRTMDEIIQWRHLSEGDRATLMHRLSGQQSTHRCPSCHQAAYCDLAAGQTSCWCYSVEKREPAHSAPDAGCLCRQCLNQQPLAV